MRFLAKIGTYGIMHMLISFIVALLITGELHLAIGISLLEPIVQIVFFSIHEYFWNKSNPGVPSPHKGCCSTSITDKISKTLLVK